MNRIASPRPGEPPGPAHTHEIGTTDDCLELMCEWFREFGDTYRVFAPRRGSWTWVIHHPDDIKHVLVTNHRNYTKGVGIDRVRLLLGDGIMTSEGGLWRRQRRMMQPSFHRKVIERFENVILAHGDEMLGRWTTAAERGEPVDVTECTSELALNVMLDATFSRDLEALVAGLKDNPFLMVTRESRRDPKFAYEFRQLGRHVRALVRRRRARGVRHFDFMQMLMESVDAGTGQGMSERQLIDEILTLVVAGHETTASALNWSWWLLGRDPDVERRLHEELDGLGLSGAGFAVVEQLPYTRQVLEESMRLYPPGWLLTRRTTGPDHLGGYAVPAGTDVFLSPYVVHRHPQFWDNPQCFDPARFAPGRAEGRHKFAYLPFGAGPRHCIGENFALYEMILHMNVAARRVRLKPVDAGPAPLEARINLRPARDFLMRVEIR